MLAVLALTSVAFSSSPSVRKLNIVFGNSGVGNGNPAKNALLFGDGHGRFELDSLFSELGISRDTRALATGDIDGDGFIDLVVGNDASNTPFSPGTNQLFLGNGTGGFLPPTNLPGGQVNTRALSVADANGDGKLDIFIGNYDPAGPGPNQLLLNQGGATFAVQDLPTSASSLTSSAQQTLALEVSDLDGDGDMDVVVGHDRALNEILVNDGSGNFVARALGSTTLTTDSLAVGDIDGDSLVDIVEGNAGDGEFADGTNYLHMNQGEALLTSVEPFTSLALPSSDGGSAYTNVLKVGDVDGDGTADIIVGNYKNYAAGMETQSNQLLRNRGKGGDGLMTFEAEDLPRGDAATLALGLADVDNDGDLDIVCGNYDGPNTLLKNDGKGVFTASDLPGRSDDDPNLADNTNALVIF